MLTSKLYHFTHAGVIFHAPIQQSRVEQAAASIKTKPREKERMAPAFIKTKQHVYRASTVRQRWKAYMFSQVNSALQVDFCACE